MQPLVALTLDDFIGIEELDILAGRGAKATLFLTGGWVISHPDTAQRAVADGHELGNHTFDHPLMSRLSAAGMRGELDLAASTIAGVTGAAPIPAFRPPYGDFNQTVDGVAARAGYDVYFWSIDSNGWRRSATSRTATCGADRLQRHLSEG